jgi:hypothetical protein
MSGSLLRSELLRFRSRRFIQLLLALGLVGFLVAVGVASTQFAKASPEGLAAAERSRDEAVREQEGFRQQCLQNPPPATELPPEVPEDQAGGVLLRERPPRIAFPLEQFHRPAAVPARRRPARGRARGGRADRRAGVRAGGDLRRCRVVEPVDGGAAVSGSRGAGGSWRPSSACSPWPPRCSACSRRRCGRSPRWSWPAPGERRRPAAGLLERRGRPAGPLVLLAVLAALLGFGLANLVRNTGAALGVGFLYFAIIENILRVASQRTQRYLLSDNVAALLLDGGHRSRQQRRASSTRRPAPSASTGREVVLSNVHGAVVSGWSTAALVGLGWLLFAKRDLH